MQARSSLFFCLRVFAFVGIANANSFGNYFATGPVSSGNFISQANSTLVVPAAPSPILNEVSLWVGMGMSNGDLIQALAVNSPGGR